MSYFLHWKDHSAEFLKDTNRTHGGGHKRGKKSFASPYIKYIPKSDLFNIIIPAQIIRADEFDDLYWEIELNGVREYIEINPYQCVTGYKTEEVSYTISGKTIFSAHSFSLMNGDEKLRAFRIKSEKIRLFDIEGDLVRTDGVQPGLIYSFTDKDFVPQSEALIETENIMGLLRSTFELVKGDLIRLPDGNPIVAGGKIREGLLPRGCVEGVISVHESEIIPVYMNAPIIIVKTLSKRISGTAICINKKNYHLTEKDKVVEGVSEFELNNRTGEKGYLIDLQAFSINKDGIFDVRIDIPNDHALRHWKFSMVRGLEYEFEDSPYIFTDRGTLSLPASFDGFPVSDDIQCLKQERMRYNFNISAGEEYLYFNVGGMRLGFEIPIFSYQFDGEEWYAGAHMDIWHTMFNPKLRIKYVTDKIRIFLDDTGHEHADEHSEMFYKNKSKNLFECDLNRFKSWFGRDQIRRTLYIDVPEKKEPIQFLNVITRSVLRDSLLKADYDNNMIIGSFDIIGYSEYYADIYYQGECICEKVRLIDGHMEVQAELKSGHYEVVVYEIEEDDTGFGDDVFYEVGRKTVELLNVTNLNEESIEISMIRPIGDAAFFLPLNCSYYVVDLKKREKTDIHNYRGKMIVVDYSRTCIATFIVNIEFFDLEHLGQVHITFVDDEEELEFLYDGSSRIIVKQEDPRLSKSQAYRRYKNILYKEDYIFNVHFIIPAEGMLELDVDDGIYNNTDESLKRKTNLLFKWK